MLLYAIQHVKVVLKEWAQYAGKHVSPATLTLVYFVQEELIRSLRDAAA
jgi:hypothetical protein